MIQVPGQFIFIPKASGMLRHGSMGGIFNGNLLFTPEKMYILPDQSISGAGMSVDTIRLSMDGQPISAYVQAHVDGGRSTEALISAVESWMEEVGLEPELHALDHQKLQDFKVKSGFFGGSVMFRSPKDGWRDAFSIKSKWAKDLQSFLNLA